MPENIMDKLTEAVSRRSFLGTMSAAAAALVLSICGITRAGGVVAVACCQLCVNPNTCSFSSCSCIWSWLCANADGTCSRCRECYATQPPPCGPGCTGVKCSRAVTVSCTGPTPEEGKEDPNPPRPIG
jgi:hypothetical protein